METTLIKSVLFVFAIIIIVYAIVRVICRNTVILSKLSGTPSNMECDQYYFLPAGKLTITATATVLIGKSGDDFIENKKLLKLTFDVASSIEPDTSNIIGVHYTGDIFGQDDISIVTSADALLDNVSISTEDRLSFVIAKVSDSITSRAASNFMALKTEDGLVQVANDANITYTTQEFKRIFVIPAQDYGVEEKMVLEWDIEIPGKSRNGEDTINASFKLSGDFKTTPLFPVEASYAGLYTRPLRQDNIKVLLALPGTVSGDRLFSDKEITSFSCLLPDKSSIIKIPLKRSYFVKKVQVPKFAHGILIANTVSKPSEFEGFIAIPINIIKAILAIPAALFQYKITHVQQETQYQQALNNLAAAREQGRMPIAGSSSGNQTVPHDQLPGNGTTKEYEKPKRFPKLAKTADLTPAKNNKNIKKQELIKPAEIKALVPVNRVNTGLDAPVLPFSWAKTFTGVWNDYNNYSAKTCVPAACAHQILSWTVNSGKGTRDIPTADVIAAYSSVSAYDPVTKKPDPGCNPYEFLQQWKEKGFWGDAINDFVPVQPRNVELVKLIAYWFGGCMITLDMPISAREKKIWKSPSGEMAQLDIKGSWGNHTVPVLGFDGTYLLVISCEQVIQMEISFFKKYNNEVYLLLSADWCTDAADTTTKSGLAFSQLTSAMDTINKNYTA